MSAPRNRLLTSAGAVGAVVAGLLAAEPASALVPVPTRTVLEVNRIDSPTSAALPDGRLLLGWTNGTNSGDTTNAQVRPSGGVLPPTFQTLRTGGSSESLRFVPGGPVESPVITTFQEPDSRSPFNAKLDGDTFTTQTPILSGTFSTGRFPSYTRCPDQTTAFAYQFTGTGTPQLYTAVARLADAKGAVGATSFVGIGSPDSFQDPTVTCDQNVPLFAYANDRDGDAGPQGKRLQVRQLSLGGPAVLDRMTADGVNASAPEARVAPNGRLWIVWTEFPNAGTPTTYFSTRAPGATGAATAPAVLDATGQTESLFFDAAGNTHVLVENRTMGSASYGIRTAAPGASTFGPVQELLPPASQTAELLTGHPDGNPRLLVIKRGSAPTNERSYELRGIPQAGSGSDATPVGFVHNGFRTASFLPSGDLFMAGSHEVAPQRVELREGGLDTGAPPTLTGVQVPSVAAPGEAIALAIDARDPLGLSTFAWTVDGQTLSDQDTSFTFPRPGTYVVTARAVDRAGNASELTRTVRVLDPAAVSPGTAEFADAVAARGGVLTPAPAPDTTAPTLTKATAIRGRRGKAKGKITVSLSGSEVAAADLELVGTLKRGKQNGRLILKSARIGALAAGAATRATLTVPTSLSRLVANKLSVRVTLTDSAGNRSVKTVPVTTAKK